MSAKQKRGKTVVVAESAWPPVATSRRAADQLHAPVDLQGLKAGELADGFGQCGQPIEPAVAKL